MSGQREAYQPPSQSQPAATSIAFDSATPSTQYLCGDCNNKVQLKKGDPIRCKECGHRVLYKERTKRYGTADSEILKTTYADPCIAWSNLRRVRGYEWMYQAHWLVLGKSEDA